MLYGETQRQAYCCTTENGHGAHATNERARRQKQKQSGHTRDGETNEQAVMFYGETQRQADRCATETGAERSHETNERAR